MEREEEEKRKMLLNGSKGRKSREVLSVVQSMQVPSILFGQDLVLGRNDPQRLCCVGNTT